MEHRRTSHQSGSLTLEARKHGPAVWAFRWREKQPDGTLVKRKVILGSKVELPSRTAAQRKADTLRVSINSASATLDRGMTVGSLLDHYKEHEVTRDRLTASTVKVYEHHLDAVIRPKWASHGIGDIKPIDFERWLKSLPGADNTKCKTRNVLSVAYQHAIRQGWMTTNPISSVRQSAKRLKEPDVLTSNEVAMILADLPQPARTAFHIAATTGLRRGEIFGLQWQDVDLERGLIRITKSVVNQVVGEPKTAGSKRPLPIDASTIAILREWKATTAYSEHMDWVLASPSSFGRNPYVPKTMLDRHVKPAAKRAGITKTIGWHTFRRTYATLLESAGAGVKVSQELMRHASPVMTMGTYAQAVTEDKRAAQNLVAAMFGAATESLGPLWPQTQVHGPENRP